MVMNNLTWQFFRVGVADPVLSFKGWDEFIDQTVKLALIRPYLPLQVL